jgi:hypothetical protein
MSHPRWSLALLALGLGAVGSPAQNVGFFNPHHSYGGISVSGVAGGPKGKAAIQITVSSYSSRAYLVTPYAYLPPSPVTVVYYTPPPVVVVTPPRLLLDDFRLQAPPLLRPIEPMPPADAGPVRPPEREARPAQPAPPKPTPIVRPEPPLPPQIEEREDEKVRLIRLGREAMARSEYGRAAERFRQAGVVAPGEALPQFLLAQALLALGKYRDAVDALYAGLALEPAWPAATFRPLELYGPNVVDYSEHLRRLDEILTRHPDDPVLLFLSAYALWFDGRKDEARVLFRRALPGATNPAVIERFLDAVPAAPIL